MNSNNYEVIFGENLSDKITKLKKGGVKALGVVYKGTPSPFQSTLRFIWVYLVGF